MKFARRAAAAALAVLLLAGCGAAPSGSDGGASNPPQSTSPPAEPTPEPHTANTRMPLPAAGISALTGRAAENPGRRPVAVMVSGDAAARPQWGIAAADLLIEANTGGENTSLMAVFDSLEKAVKVGPVCQGRDLFLQLVMPVNAIPMYIGCDIYTSNLVNWFTYQPLDGVYIGVNAYNLDGQRDLTAPQELSWYADNRLIQSAMESYGQSVDGETPTFFYFNEAAAPAKGNGYRLDIGYGAQRTAQLVYDEGEDCYFLKENDQDQLDGTLEDGRVRCTNVVLLMASSGFKDDGVTRDYDMTGGDGLYLSGGGAVQIKWKKGEADQPLQLFDAAGQPLSVRPGRSYIGVWGGFEGQSLRLLDSAGAEQPLPAAPAPMAPVPATPAPATPVPATPVPATPVPATPAPEAPAPAASAPVASTPEAPAPAASAPVTSAPAASAPAVPAPAASAPATSAPTAPASAAG